MAGEPFAIALVLGLFAFLPVIASRPKLDLVAYAIVATVISSIVTAIVFPTPAPDFIRYIRFEPLIYIVSINIIVIILERNSVFQFIAVKTIHLTKSNPRVFFAFICIISCFTSSVMEDVSVALIFIPIVIQACKMLNIRPAPFIFGIAVCLNIGNLLMPFSNSQNIIIAEDFGLDVPWFAGFMFPILVLSMLVVIVYIDFFEIRKQEPPTEEFKDILLKVLQPTLVVANSKKFHTAVVFFVCIIVCLSLIPFTYLVALIGALILCFLERESLTAIFKKVDWGTAFFFVTLFIMTGCMEINGTMGAISGFITQITTGSPFIASIVILIISSLVTSLLSPNPATVFFLPVLKNLFSMVPSIGGTMATRTPSLIAFLLGLNIGGNFLPQGAPPYVVTLGIAEKYKIDEINFKSMTKVGIMFSIIHILLSFGYLALVCMALGVA